VSGINPQGRGCLIALLAVFIGLPFLACIGFFGLSLVGGLLGVASASATPTYR